jgi:DNA-binding SARP family transcriptional activator/nucleoid-associated protein YgaU
MRYLRAFAAAGVLLLVLGGIPVLLAAVMGDPRPGWQALWVGDVSDSAVLDVLATLTWLGWVYFTGTVIIEIVHLLRSGRGSGWVPGRAQQQRLAGRLLASVIVTLPLVTSTQALATSAAPQGIAAVASASPLPGALAGPSPGGAGNPTGSPTASPTAAPSPDAGAGQGRPDGDSVREYRIDRHGPGTFWALAQTFLGDGARWREIWQLNQGRVQADGARLNRPGFLRVGWTVLVPASAQTTNPETATPSSGRDRRDPGADLTYTVRSGDYLGAIAERFLGDGDRYGEIRSANTDLMPTPTGPHGADHIQTGWRLTLPPGARDRGPIPHASGPRPHHLNPSAPRPTPSSPDPTAPNRPPATPPRLPSPPAAHPSPPASPPGEQASTPEHPGVWLPGGWMDLPLAAALVAAAAAVWIRRRMTHLYPPLEEDPSAGDTDDDLQALPAVMTRLRRAVREHAQHLPVVDTDLTGAGITHIRSGSALAVLPAEGVGLVGAGATSAARALLVAALSVPDPDTARSCGEVVLTRSTLNSLLPGWQPPATGFGQHLIMTADPDEALAVIEERLHDRQRVPLQVVSRELPPVLLITENLPAQGQTRLVQALRQGFAVNIRAVVLGEGAPGPTLIVNHHGHTAGLEGFPDRVPVLDENTTTSLLAVLQEAFPGPSSAASLTAPALTGRHGASTQKPLIASQPTESTAAAGFSQPAMISPHHRPTPDGTPTSRRVRVTVLGRPTITHHDGSPVSGVRRHATELLVYLAVHRDGAQLPEIMEALWPDAILRRAEQRLSTEVSNLRRCIRTAAKDQQIQPVVNTGGRYHLDPDLLDIDLWRFLDHVAAATATTDSRERAAELRAAVSVPFAALAEGCDYDWIETDREHVRRQGIRARLALATHPDTNDQEIAYLSTQAADLDPASEDLAQQAMRANAAINNHHGVHERLVRLRAALQAIGEQPSAETLTLATDLAAPRPEVPS